MATQWTVSAILALSGAYNAGCALQTAVQLDVFTTLEKEPQLSCRELARKLRCDERAFAMLASALISLGFLDQQADRLLLPQASRLFLSRSSDQYLGYIIQHHAHIQPAWTRLAEAIRSGKPIRETSSSHTESAEEREAFLMGMFNVAMNQAEKVAAALDLSARKRLIDIGGGPGTYAAFFCKTNPHLSATIFDRPTSEEFAMRIVRRFGLEKRVDFAGGDFLRDALPDGYDAAWLSQVLHGENPADAAKLVARAAGTLNPGGLLAIQEFIVDDDRRGPTQSTLFSLNMLVGTPGGQAYTQSEISAMLRDAGVVSVSRLPAELPPGCGILVGVMPE
ncbi:SAM-dependent methyltransferase [Deltaproteobacteria bacterium]|nr:SAM-dependent methyltransferase [Deltaproteobacteria bacterium]